MWFMDQLLIRPICGYKVDGNGNSASSLSLTISIANFTHISTVLPTTVHKVHIIITS